MNGLTWSSSFSKSLKLRLSAQTRLGSWKLNKTALGQANCESIISVFKEKKKGRKRKKKREKKKLLDSSSLKCLLDLLLNFSPPPLDFSSLKGITWWQRGLFQGSVGEMGGWWMVSISSKWQSIIIKEKAGLQNSLKHFWNQEKQSVDALDWTVCLPAYIHLLKPQPLGGLLPGGN